MSFYYLPTANYSTTATPLFAPAPVSSFDNDHCTGGLRRQQHHFVDDDDAFLSSAYSASNDIDIDMIDPLEAQERAALAQLRAVQAERARRQQQQQQQQRQRAMLEAQRQQERERLIALEVARQQQRQQAAAERERERQRQCRLQQQAQAEARARAIAAAYERELVQAQAQAQAERQRQLQQEQRERHQAAIAAERQRRLALLRQQQAQRQHQQQQQEQAQHQQLDQASELGNLMSSLFAPFWVQYASDNGEEADDENKEKKQANDQDSCCGKQVPCCKKNATSRESKPNVTTSVQAPASTAAAASTADEQPKQPINEQSSTSQTEENPSSQIESFVKDILGAFLGPQAQIQIERLNQNLRGGDKQEPQDEKKKNGTNKSATEASTSNATNAPAPAQPTKTQLEGEAANEIEQALDGLFGAFKSAFGGEENEKEDAKKSNVKADKGKGRAVEPELETTEKTAASTEPTPAPGADDIPESAAHLAAEREQSAAELIQQQYRRHLNRVKRLEKLEALERKLNKLDAGFTFPEQLDFADPEELTSNGTITPQDPVDGASSASGDDVSSLAVPPLAFTPTNQAYHHHAQSLLSLLVSADTISSDGDQDVRQSRKDFVKRVEGKLAEMEKKRRQVWEKQQEKKVEVKNVEQEKLETAAGEPIKEDKVEATEEHKVEAHAESAKVDGETAEPASAQDTSKTGVFSDSENGEEKKDGYEMI